MFIKVEKEKVDLQFYKRDNANIALKKACPGAVKNEYTEKEKTCLIQVCLCF